MAKQKKAKEFLPSTLPMGQSLAKFFTANDGWRLHNLQREFEGVMYHYYKDVAYDNTYDIFGVKSNLLPVHKLEETDFCEDYNQYVEEAKKLDKNNELMGIQLEFYWEKKIKPPVKDFTQLKSDRKPIIKDAKEEIDDV